MTGLEEQIKKLSVDEARSSFSKNSIATELKYIRGANDHSANAMERLVQVIQRRYKSQITKADFRQGVSTDSRIESASDLNRDEIEVKIERWIDPQLIDCQCNSQPAPTIVEFEEGGKRFHVVSAPLFSADLENVEGAVATLVESTESHESIMAEFEALALGTSSDSAGDPSTESNSALQVLKKVGGISSVRELGYLLSNQLASKYGCEQVAFGQTKNDRAQVVAISGVTTFKANSPGVVSIQQSMDECIDQGESIVSQARGESELENGYRIHQQWSKQCSDASVCSIPLKCNESVVAVASFQRDSSQPFSQKEVLEIEERIEGFGPAVQLIKKANLPKGEWVRSAISESIRQVVSPKSWIGKICLVAFLLVTAYMIFGTSTYRPRCVASLSPAETTHFSAPFDTVLKSVHVNAGDEVEKGQLLFVMDTRELESRLGEVTSQLASHNVELKSAIASGNVTKAAQYRKLNSALRAQRDSLTRKIEKSKVRAPANGIITECELSKKVGQTFRIGDEMLTFAQKDNWQVEVNVPDHVASYVRNEQTVRFASTTRPGEVFEFKIDQFERNAQVKNGRNVFVAKGRLTESKGWMRSGMEGFARIETVEKPVWWVSFHRVIDLARIHFWF